MGQVAPVVSVDTYDYEAADGSYLFSVIVERGAGDKRVRQGIRRRDGSTRRA